jgi:hypothetical protein
MYGYRFNNRYEHDGHVFERRFGSSEIASEAHLLATIQYIALNPVRAGLCADPADWRWSSFRATARLEPSQRFLAAHRVRQLFGANAHVAAAEYAAFVRSGIAANAVLD